MLVALSPAPSYTCMLSIALRTMLAAKEGEDVESSDREALMDGAASAAAELEAAEGVDDDEAAVEDDDEEEDVASRMLDEEVPADAGLPSSPSCRSAGDVSLSPGEEEASECTSPRGETMATCTAVWKRTRRPFKLRELPCDLSAGVRGPGVVGPVLLTSGVAMRPAPLSTAPGAASALLPLAPPTTIALAASALMLRSTGARLSAGRLSGATPAGTPP